MPASPTVDKDLRVLYEAHAGELYGFALRTLGERGAAKALGRLTSDHRRALIEVAIRERTVNEAASVLGVPPGTVKSRLFYGLRPSGWGWRSWASTRRDDGLRRDPDRARRVRAWRARARRCLPSGTPPLGLRRLPGRAGAAVIRVQSVAHTLPGRSRPTPIRTSTLHLSSRRLLASPPPESRRRAGLGPPGRASGSWRRSGSPSRSGQGPPMAWPRPVR